MSPHTDPEAAFAAARPDDPSPGTAVDVKRAMRDGYRYRRRNRAMIGGATTAGVFAVAAALALSVSGLPGEAPDQAPPAAEEPESDTAHAAYPGSGVLGDWAVPQPELQEATFAAFGDLAVETGFLDEAALDYELPSEAEIEATMAEGDLGYYDARSELGFQDQPLLFRDWTSPVDAGRSHLRGYTASDGDEEVLVPSFTVTALQPGGWTAEPGPAGGAVFPQHLIGDGASWTDLAPELTTEELGDGRTITIADHGCALEAAVAYPNGSALRSAWNLDCEGEGREMSAARLREAMLAMPEIDYDTSELAPIDALLEYPDAWEYDEDWEAEAEADAQASIDAATDALDAAHPGMEPLSAGASQLQQGTGETWRTYAADYYLPFQDDAGNPVHANLRYYLPGGWLPGLPPEGSSAEVYLLNCAGSKDDVCNETEVDGRIVATNTFGVGESKSVQVIVYDEAGWAVEFATMAEGEIDGYAYEDLVDLALSLPAPVYDAEAYQR